MLQNKQDRKYQKRRFKCTLRVFEKREIIFSQFNELNLHLELRKTSTATLVQQNKKKSPVKKKLKMENVKSCFHVLLNC